MQTWEGYGAVIVTNVVLGERAGVDRGASVDAGATSTVDARTRSTLEATATSKIEGFDKTFGAVVAFNSIGWKPSNILFNALDALLGDPLISSAFNGAAGVRRAGVDPRHDVTAAGDVSVTARRRRR